MNHQGDYRSSHIQSGASYQETYNSGYYRAQWNAVERPLLAQQLKKYGGSDKSCLDFACGTGRITELCSAHFGSVVGVDVSLSMIEKIRELPRTRIYCRDISIEPIDQKFDVATAFRFFLNAEDKLRREAIQAIYHCLNPDGIFISNIHMSSTSPMGYMYGLSRILGKSNTHKTMRVTEYAKFLQSNGFTIVDSHYYSFLPRPGPLFPLTMEAALEPVERFCSRVPLIRPLAQCFLVVCRRT